MTKLLLKGIRNFFWLLSGSNIEILKDCPTDHNRHANIGLAIFTTTIIAFATGSLAGYEFGGHTVRSAIFFGLIWSLLVFTIDRTMVLTLKKNPTLTKLQRRKSLIIPVLYRLFLSALISFFISIPLELWIFRENIAEQMEVDRTNKVIQKKLSENKAFNVYGDSLAIKDYENESSFLDSLINKPEPPANYKGYYNKKENLKNLQSEYDKLVKSYSDKVKKRKEWWNKVPYTNTYKSSDTLKINPIRVNNKSSNAYKQWNDLWLETKDTDGFLTKKLKTTKEQKEDLEKELSKISTSYFESKINEKQQKDSLRLLKEKELSEKKEKIKTKEENYSKLIGSHEGFTTKWVALNNIKDSWVIFFIWFIRIVFFTIEMLPTMAKITTPVGTYDRSVYRHEKLKEKYFDEVEEIEVNKLKEIEQQKLDNELAVQKSILDNLAIRQTNIANTILDEWEKQQKEHISKNLSDFVNNNDT